MNGDKEKSFLGAPAVLEARILLDQFQNSTGFNTEQQNTCPFSSRTDFSIQHLRTCTYI